MAFVDTSYEEISEATDYENQDSSKTETSLNPQINKSFEEKEGKVYYKNPWIQTLFVLGLGLPLILMVFSSFGGSKPSENRDEEPVVDEEKVEMESALAAERAENEKLRVQNALQEQKNQQIEVIEPEPIATPLPEEVKPKPVAKKIQQPPPPKTTAPVKTVRQPPPQPIVRSAPPPKVVVEKKVEPKIDPMEEWLVLANRGHYVTAAPTVQLARNTATTGASARLVSNSSTSNNSSNKAKNPLYRDSEIEKRLNSSVALLEEENLSKRLERSDSDTVSALYSGSASEVDSNLSQLPEDEKTDKATYISNNLRGTKTIDVGSAVEATLESSVVWTNQTDSQSEKKYLLRFKEGLRNVSGEEVLPEGTRAIAMVTEFSSSGLLFMEVIELIDEEGKKIAVPPGAMQIEGKNGSPLKAELKRKGGSDFLADVGSILAPGVERAFSDIGDSADTIFFDGGDSSFSRSRNGRKNPLASGVAGVADGTSRVLERRLQRTQQEISAYFQLESGEKVRLVVYEDFGI